jgi:hypothetical protein
LYSELFRMALAEHNDDTVPLAEVVANLTTTRANLDAEINSMGRLADALAYDVALARMCRRLGVSYDVTGTSLAEVRQRAEGQLLECLPALAEIAATDPQKLGAEGYG